MLTLDDGEPPVTIHSPCPPNVIPILDRHSAVIEWHSTRGSRLRASPPRPWSGPGSRHDRGLTRAVNSQRRCGHRDEPFALGLTPRITRRIYPRRLVFCGCRGGLVPGSARSGVSAPPIAVSRSRSGPTRSPFWALCRNWLSGFTV